MTSPSTRRSDAEPDHPRLSPESVRELLVLRPGGLGDVVRAVPALRHLRVTFPDARISVVADEPGRALLQGCPYVDRVIAHEQSSSAQALTCIMSDKAQLIEFGFSEAKVVRALKATGNAGLQPALDWLEKHADDPEPTGDEGGDATMVDAGGEDDEAKLKELENAGEAKSLVCQCGKKFRNTALAEFHADKSGHDQFSESTEEIKPLTEEYVSPTRLVLTYAQREGCEAGGGECLRPL